MSVEDIRKELRKRVPDLESDINNLPDTAIEVLHDASKLSPERRAAFVAMLGKGEKHNEH